MVEAPDVHVDQGDGVLVVVSVIIGNYCLTVSQSLRVDDVSTLRVPQIDGKGLSFDEFVLLGGNPA